MSVKQFAAQLKAKIEEIKVDGTATINCDTSITYLDKVQNPPESEACPFDLKRYEADLQNWVENNKADDDGRLYALTNP